MPRWPPSSFSPPRSTATGTTPSGHDSPQTDAVVRAQALCDPRRSGTHGRRPLPGPRRRSAQPRDKLPLVAQASHPELISRRWYHALCWVHAERLVHKLDTFTDHQRRMQQYQRALIWWFYRDLKAYRREPTPRRRSELRARFDRIFGRRTGFVVLDRLLARLHANKSELLRVLDRPDIPLHTNGSENDIRCYVTRRKISG